MEGRSVSQAVQVSKKLPRTTWLPFALPHITQAEIDEVVDTLRSGWLTTGLKTRRFEKEFAHYVDVPHAVAVNSATAAMHLALDAIGIQEGDEVIVPVYTFTATAEVVIHCRAHPVFVDVDPITCNLDPLQLEKSITARTRAIIVVDIAGLPAEMDAIRVIAESHGLPVIEDAAHAFPASYRGQRVGSINELTAFSFYATKTLTTGEGGMLTTANPEYAQRAAVMALHGISHDAWKRYAAGGSWYYEVVDAGYKYNMTDIAASLGLHQLARSTWLLQRRQEIAQRYTLAFSCVPEVITPPNPIHCVHAWHLYLLRLRLESLNITRAAFIQAMAETQIGTSVHFIPLHIQPFYRDRYQLTPESFPVAFQAYQQAVSLPIYPGMTDEDVSDVIEAVTDIIKASKK
ncbi:DegT/DnrJ/EryC1/StrS family aminotransferase [Dictyobacter arantiisoli]|uniref:Spore coat protein n=1 Tax=Dictyobacter arantiisoli TaxID=2014874 RepID=A0A5A5TG81_9CHLR|nr:DegT/DnrJ/EryC1/StrS family aminotransferase [Dictyobacter arantiisoli]GCF10073.1 spore coat protein [Dictyobacter arantiisoli]